MEFEIPIPICTLEFPFKFEIDSVRSLLASFTPNSNIVIDLVFNSETWFAMKVEGGGISE